MDFSLFQTFAKGFLVNSCPTGEMGTKKDKKYLSLLIVTPNLSLPLHPQSPIATNSVFLV